MSEIGKITLQKSFFTEKERSFFEYKGIEVSTFIYDSGIHAIRIKNENGYIIMLPFKGQQIWDAVFNDRELKMSSLFKEPRNVENFIDSYGCFMMHCGALRMGCPGPEDDYPLHGELPYAEYDKAEILFGEDEKGAFVGLTGVFEYNRGFGDNYYAKPTVKMHKNSSMLNVDMTIENLSNYPMELMYMCHVNFIPADNGRIVQSCSWNNKDTVVRTTIPGHVNPTESFLAFLDELKEDPKRTEILKVEDEYDPEIVFSFNNLVTDKDGISHFMQVHSDGTSDYVGYKPSEFDFNSRWIYKAKNTKVLGLTLPATANSDGYTIEKKNGHVKEIAPKHSISFSVLTGALGKSEAVGMEANIKDMLK